MKDRLPRKLVAVLHADIIGYSRMASEDEDGTRYSLKGSAGTGFNISD